MGRAPRTRTSRLMDMVHGLAANGAAAEEAADVQSVIRELRVDGRLPVSELARRSGTSVGRARSILSELLEHGIISITPIVNPLLIGYRAIAFIELERVTTRPIEEIIAEFEGVPEIDYVAWTSGAVELIVNVITRDTAHLSEIIERRIRPIPGVRIRSVAPYLRFPYQKTGRTVAVTRFLSDTVHEIDWLDSALIRSLARDSRASNTRIARELGVSEAVIRARLKRLTADGVMRVGAILNTRSSAREPTAIVRVTANSEIDELVHGLHELQFVTFIAEVAADFDLVVEVTGHDMDDMADALTTLRRLPGIVHMSSSLCFDVRYKPMIPPAS